MTAPRSPGMTDPARTGSPRGTGRRSTRDQGAPTLTIWPTRKERSDAPCRVASHVIAITSPRRGAGNANGGPRGYNVQRWQLAAAGKPPSPDGPMQGARVRTSEDWFKLASREHVHKPHQRVRFPQRRVRHPADRRTQRAQLRASQGTELEAQQLERVAGDGQSM